MTREHDEGSAYLIHQRESSIAGIEEKNKLCCDGNNWFGNWTGGHGDDESQFLGESFVDEEGMDFRVVSLESDGKADALYAEPNLTMDDKTLEMEPIGEFDITSESLLDMDELDEKERRRKRRGYFCVGLLLLTCLGALFIGLYFGVWQDDPPRTEGNSALETPIELATVAPLDQEEVNIMDALNPYTDTQYVLDESTPQGKAFAELVLQEKDSNRRTPPKEALQRFSLLTLYHATSGENWTVQYGWNGALERTCAWYGIGTCRSDATGKLAVANLNLANNNLKGNLPEEICLICESLESLDLSGNQLSGTIPSCLSGSGCPKLESLVLDGNQLTR